MARSKMDKDEIVILRCCRDWPIHVYATFNYGKCGICKTKPEVVYEKYPESQYAKNRTTPR